MLKQSLNGSWKLHFYELHSADINTPEELLSNGTVKTIDAKVPGNIELDLSRAGFLPEDLFMGDNLRKAQDFEYFEFWYETDFEIPEEFEGKPLSINFEGADCICEYFVNGVKVGESKNALIPYELELSGKVELQKKNKLFVHIRPALWEEYNHEIEFLQLANGYGGTKCHSLHVRKAPSMYGWDIMARALLGGLWKDVDLVAKTSVEIHQLAYLVEKYPNRISWTTHRYDLKVCYDLKVDHVIKNMKMRIVGTCKDKTFTQEVPVIFNHGNTIFTVEDPYLWWPYGYGEPNIYDTTVEFIEDGVVVASGKMNVGFRTVELERTDMTDGVSGYFRFLVNDTLIVCKGSNWVPMDAFHSRDKERYAKALELVKDVGCNILRCWGGNVYEQDEFYDFCDKNGIMIWQDFCMACQSYPLEDEFLNMMYKEAEAVIRRLRNHPAIIVWGGDNEGDSSLWYPAGLNPADNYITRKLIPNALLRNDKQRPYIPSSPYYSEKVVAETKNANNFLPESHPWGSRDYYKAEFYSQNKAHFISETGYHACTSVESTKKFIEEDFLWPPENNPQWNTHSTDWAGRSYRTALMADQIEQFFGSRPDNLEDFAVASQISQAEAKKYFIERVRLDKPNKTGIIWWNLIDGWPQFSDAVVDYYYDKKIAYDYIKRSQQPFAIMCSEIKDWNINLVAVNDTLETKKGTYKVTDMDSGKVMLEGSFEVGPNADAKTLDKMRVMYSEKGCFLIEWWIDGERYINHYLYGFPAFDFEKYKEWMSKIK